MKKFHFLDNISVSLLTGGISASIAILVAEELKKYLKKKTDILEHSTIEAIGILTGTVVVIIMYLLFKKKS